MRRIPFSWIVGILFVGWLLGGDDKSSTTEPRRTTESITPISRLVETPKTTQRIAKPQVTLKKVLTQPQTQTPTVEQPLNILPTTTMYVDASRLNVRKGPGTNHKQIWTLKRDQSVSVIQKNGEWALVQGTRFKGWVHAGYLTPNKTPVNTVSLPKPKKTKPRLSDKKIISALIRRSIGLYRGNCPCPYNRTSRGRKCGGRSAWSRPGGEEPLCYPSDVSKQMIAQYRARQ